jgi:cytochrome P450 family 110
MTMKITVPVPSAFKKPSWMQQIQWVVDPIGYMATGAGLYPDIFKGEVVGFGESLVFVNQPQAIQEILQRDIPIGNRTPAYSAPGALNRILMPILGDASVIMLEGDRHRKRRQLVMPPFHGERMRAYGQLIRELTTKAFDAIPLNQTFEARTVTQEISLNIILKAVFGLSEGDRFQQFKSLMTAVADLFQSPLTSSFLFYPVLQKDLGAWSPWGRFLRDRQRLDDLIYSEIAGRRSDATGDRIDILSLLLSARDEAGEPMSDRELRDELMALLFAGHETTATAMAWALYWVHSQPEVRTQLRQELATLGDNPDAMEVFRLPYLTAVCNETLRIHPVAMLTFPRQVEAPVEVLGFDLKPGTIVVGCIYLVHHRSDLYPNSHEFNPDRFMERSFTPYEFMPFGGGARRCIGEALAMYEMKLVLAQVLTRYEFDLVDSKPEVPRRRGVTLAPANGVRLRRLGFTR